MIILFIQRALFLLAFITANFGYANLYVGIGKSDITPPIGTSSAGYAVRQGEGMEGVHDPLAAIALFMDNGEKRVVFCSVDHLGFTYEMVQEIVRQVHQVSGLADCEIYIGSSHTHSGGGAYLNIPVIGETLAGPYNRQVTQFYIEKTVEAIVQSSQNLIPGKAGVGYGKAADLSFYRGAWPKDETPLPDVTLIKVDQLDGAPFAALFNYAVHPTVLNGTNRLFSADLVGYTREHIKSLIGENVEAIYFNGAQGDINPVIFNEEDRFESCDILAQSLAQTVEKIWSETQTSEVLHIQTQKESYAFEPKATPFGLLLPIKSYQTEMNLIVLNHLHVFLTIPGELSSIYDKQVKELGQKLGYQQVSIFGLTNDAHGYIILPESWRHKTAESGLSFAGENYGEETKSRIETLLRRHM